MASPVAHPSFTSCSPGCGGSGSGNGSGSGSRSGGTPLLGLLDLPNELLQTIAACLIPDPPTTTRFALRPAGTWEFREASGQWLEWKIRHRDLQSFIQTCHRMSAVAGSYQYHSIVVHSGTALVRLFRHLVERPGVEQWIKNLSCLVNLLDKEVVDDAKHEWASQIAGGFRLRPDLFIHAPLYVAANPEPPSDPNSSVAIILFNFIVSYADNLADLLLAYPDQSSAGLNDALITLLWEHTPPFASKVTVPSPEPQFFPTKAALSRLTSLRLYCNREHEEPGRNETFTQHFAAYVVSILPDLRALKKLEFCCDSLTTWSPLLLEGGQHPGLPSIETVRLYGSHIREPELVVLCKACVNLRSLVVHFEESCDDEVDRPRLPGGNTLNDALLGLSDSLQHLELVVLTEGHYLTRGDERPRKRENHRLTCFPALYRLRHLTVDYRGLFGTLGIFEYEDGERLRDLLPASLQSFTLICEWGTDKDFKPVYLANLEMILDGIKLLCACDCPRLSSICLAIPTWLERSKYRTKYRKSLDDVESSCERAGISFRVHDLLPQYRDEDDEIIGEELEGDEDEEEEEVEEEVEEEADEEDSEFYFSGAGDDEEGDLERDARRPASLEEFIVLLGEDHGHDPDELYYAYYEDRWDEYLF